MAFRHLVPFATPRTVALRRGRDPFGDLHDNMNRMLDGFFGTLGTNRDSEHALGFGFPSLDVVESEEELRIEAELPGVAQDDVDVSVEDGVLTIRGEKRSEERSEKDDLRHVERAFGSFQRQIALPFEVELDQVDASYKNGVLTVRLPRSKDDRKRARKIDVRSSD